MVYIVVGRFFKLWGGIYNTGVFCTVAVNFLMYSSDILMHIDSVIKYVIDYISVLHAGKIGVNS
jgi:hypothetical protein